MHWRSAESRLAEALDELQEVRQALTEERQRTAMSGERADAEVVVQVSALTASLEEMRREAETLCDERDELRLRVENSESQLARLAEVEEELATVRYQLTGAQEELQSVKLVGRRSTSEGTSTDQLLALEQEREALEKELEVVRNRAAELNETVAEQQRAIAEQKTELSSELQQLRKLVEKQADLIADRAGMGSIPTPVVAAPVTVQTQPSDPVVTSVMAQFVKLQKDVAQRRRRKA